MLVDAGGTPCALDALCVRGVQGVDGAPALRDLSQLLGGGPEAQPGLAVALEVPAGMVLRVRQVHGVVDVAGARSHLLPAGVSRRLGRVARGALELEGGLYLDVDLLTLDGALPVPEPPAADVVSGEPLEGRTLVFRAGERAWALPLSAVTHVMQSPGMCPTPGRSAALVSHGGALWPLFALGRTTRNMATVVLAEHLGRPVGLLASEVLGIFDQPVPAAQPGTWSVPGVDSPAVGLDLGLLFA